MVDEMGWWVVPIVCLVIFTLYGIEGIGSQLEDPFGYDRNDIKMDALVGDTKMEIDVVLAEWRAFSKAMESAWYGNDGNRGHGERCLDGAPQASANGDKPGQEKYTPPDLFLKRRPRTAVDNAPRDNA